MLADIAGRHNNLCLGHVVVLEEDDLEEITNILVLIHNHSDLVDEVDDGLGHPISRSSFTTKD